MTTLTAALPNEHQTLAGSSAKMIADIVRTLVDKPDAVRVQLISSQKETVLILVVAEADLASVIGYQGKTLKSLRIILSACVRQSTHPFSLQIQGVEQVLEP